MIENFEQETAPLSEYELKMVPLFVKGFKDKIGPEHAITNKQIVSSMKEKEYKINDSRVRKIINHIRINNIIPCLMATSKGYYISHDPEEINSFIESLKGRESAINKVRRAMQHQLQSMFNR